MNFNEALEEVQKEYRGDPMVITSTYEKPLSEVMSEADDEREVWVEWGDLSYGDVTVPATHIFYLDEDGYMRRDGSWFSVVSAYDYERLGR